MNSMLFSIDPVMIKGNQLQVLEDEFASSCFVLRRLLRRPESKRNFLKNPPPSLLCFDRGVVKECAFNGLMLSGRLLQSFQKKEHFGNNKLGKARKVGGTGETLKQTASLFGPSAAAIRNEHAFAPISVQACLPGSVELHGYDDCGIDGRFPAGEAVCDWNREFLKVKKIRPYSLFYEKRAIMRARWKVSCQIGQGSRACELRSDINNSKTSIIQEVTC